MSQRSRRRFLRETATASVAVAANQLFSGFARAQTATAQATGPVRLYVDTRRKRATLDRIVFGSFLENLGRAIYAGIYYPGTPRSSSDRYRYNVLARTRIQNIPIFRFPGGDIVS